MMTLVETAGDGEDYSLTSGPSNGTVTETADGVFVYTPNADFNGTDSVSHIQSQMQMAIQILLQLLITVATQ